MTKLWIQIVYNVTAILPLILCILSHDIWWNQITFTMSLQSCIWASLFLAVMKLWIQIVYNVIAILHVILWSCVLLPMTKDETYRDCPTKYAHDSVVLCFVVCGFTLQWCHNESDGISKHQPHHDCLLNHLFRHRSKKTSKLRFTGLCAGNSPVAGEFSTQRASKNNGKIMEWMKSV